MTPDLSVSEVLASLEERIAFHRQKADFHAQQEVHHREQNALHLAELKRVTEHFEAFKAVALPAAEVAREGKLPPPPQPVEEPEDDREFIGTRILPSAPRPQREVQARSAVHQSLQAGRWQAGGHRQATGDGRILTQTAPASSRPAGLPPSTSAKKPAEADSGGKLSPVGWSRLQPTCSQS
jgi:hypothetical protein